MTITIKESETIEQIETETVYEESKTNTVKTTFMISDLDREIEMLNTQKTNVDVRIGELKAKKTAALAVVQK